MPELPEVETVRRRLLEPLSGAVLAGVDLRLPRLLEVGSESDLEALRGAAALEPRRHGKYLLFPWRGTGGRETTLVVHLGMSGQLTWHPVGVEARERFRRLPSGYVKALAPHPVDRHTHLVLEFHDGSRLLFRDPRTFGRLLVLPSGEVAATPRLARLGPDALDLEVEELARRLRERRGRRPVKAVLLDQSVVAGVGNIYADEACFTAGIRPSRGAWRLSGPEIARLAEAVREALDRGLRNAGTTFRDFVHPDGSSGGNLEDLRVYARGGEPCLLCGTTLRKGVVAQRGTVWCPRCQA